jgi:hypothetical protein
MGASVGTPSIKYITRAYEALSIQNSTVKYVTDRHCEGH